MKRVLRRGGVRHYYSGQNFSLLAADSQDRRERGSLPCTND